jgi:hypothetical protein
LLPHSRRTSRTPGPTRLDQALLALLRVTEVRGWAPEEAARHLRMRLNDDRVLLHLLRARVAHAMLERPTRTDERAFATLECALGGEDRSLRSEVLRIPRQGRAHD